MSENREEILADFQACTGIEDVSEAIYFLEETNWNLLNAVNRVMPQEHTFAVSNPPDVPMIEELPALIPISTIPVEISANLNKRSETRNQSDENVQPSTSQNCSKTRKRFLHFVVHYNDKIVQIDIPDTGTVGELKYYIQTQTGISPCRQLLSGWTRSPQSDANALSNLSLPRENILFLNLVPIEDGVTANMEQNMISTYTLHVTAETTGKHYDLKYPGTRNILSVKTDIYTLTDIPVRHQIWTGWPAAVQDHTTLGLAGLTLPVHEFSVKKTVITSQSRDKNIIIDLVDSDTSSVEEFEDASESFNVEDDMFIDNLGPKKVEPLIPENVSDEAIGCIQFSEQFTARYGSVHPAFFTGTLEDALKDACIKPAKDRKILALYIHHDGSILSNVFCTQLLGYESVIQILENNFVMWGWDMTYEMNKMRFVSSMSKNLGNLAALTIRNIPVEKLPAIILIMKIRSSTDIYSVIYGNVSVNELLLRLVDAVEVFMEHQRVEVREEEERAARELVKWEQDQAYHESLEADRAKEEAKRQQEAFEIEEKKRVETKRAEEEAKKEFHRQQVEANLPPEPVQVSGDNITKIRFRLPKGDNLERRFTCNTALKVLLDYLIVKGFPPQEYKVISSWPRKDLTGIDSGKTLQELNLCPQETVILEER